jgi:hypothetical protein
VRILTYSRRNKSKQACPRLATCGQSIFCVPTELNPAPYDTAYASFKVKGVTWAGTEISYEKVIKIYHCNWLQQCKWEWGDVILRKHFLIYGFIEGGKQPLTPSRNDSGLFTGGFLFKISALTLIIQIGFCDLPGSVQTNVTNVHYIRITQIKKSIQISIILGHRLYLHHLHRLTG